MAGTTWNERQPTDWLASDGKWYSSSKYPRGWEGTALPPAPGHGGVASILKKYTMRAADLAGIDDGVPEFDTLYTGDSQSGPPPSQASAPSRPSTERQAPRVKTPPPPGGGAASGFSVVKTGRQVAQATVSEQRDYAHKLSSGAPPPPPLGSGSASTSTSPGRLRDVPAPPDSPNSVEVRQAPPPAARAAQTIDDVIAGDLGKVLGGAKKRIQQALNDAYEG